MRHLIALLGTLIFYGGIAIGATSLLNSPNAPLKNIPTETRYFDLGMMVSAQESETQKPLKSTEQQAETRLRAIAESVPEPTVEKPQPTISKQATAQAKKPKPKPPKKTQKKYKRKKALVKKTQKKNRKKIKRQHAQTQVGNHLQKTNTIQHLGHQQQSKGGQSTSRKSSKANANTYRAGLQVAIAKAAKKNHRAKRVRKKGTVIVRFQLNKDGSIRHVTLVKSSGRSVLDKIAVDILRHMGHYKPPPVGFPEALTIPIRFTLR